MKRQPILLLIASLSLGACTHYYYAPNSLQTPFLQEQGDTRASLSLIGGDEFSGWEANLVYSPVKYGALLVNHFQVTSNGNSFASDNDWGKGRLTELGLGIYYPASKKTTLSLLGGWGGGRVLNSYESGSRSDLRMERLFIQPTLAFQENWFRFGLATRINRLAYVRGIIDLGIGDTHIQTIERIERASPIWFPEFGLSIGFGTRPFWVDFKFNINGYEQFEDLGFAKSTVAMAIQFDLDYFWREPAD